MSNLKNNRHEFNIARAILIKKLTKAKNTICIFYINSKIFLKYCMHDG